MLNVLKPGSYCDDMVLVVPIGGGDRDRFMPMEKRAIDIRYDNRSVDQRMAFNSRFRSFEGLLEAILRETPRVSVE